MSGWKIGFTISKSIQKNVQFQFKVKEGPLESSWNEHQQRVLARISEHLNRDEKIDSENWPRCLVLNGASGVGKTGVMIQAVIQATHNNKSVLILCATGSMYHAFHDRLCRSKMVSIETMHAASRIRRKDSKRHGCDLIMMDETTLVHNKVIYTD